MKTKKLIFSLVGSFLMIFSANSISAMPIDRSEAAGIKLYPGTNREVQTGDILVTPASNICIAHAGIVLEGRDTIVHTPGKNRGDTVQIWSMDRWKDEYKYTEVMRHPDSYTAFNAAEWANEFKRTRNPSYDITSLDLYDLDHMYCSKFVWLAYKLGGNVDLVPYKPRYTNIPPRDLLAAIPPLFKVTRF